nr:hypothetical protein [Saccharopolyspora pogona]
MLFACRLPERDPQVRPGIAQGGLECLEPLPRYSGWHTDVDCARAALGAVQYFRDAVG